MAKVIRITDRLTSREKMSRAIRVYEQKKNQLSRLIERLRVKKERP